MDKIGQTISFPGLGIGDFTVNRVAFTLFGQPIYWYGIIIACAFLLAIGYILKRARTFGVDPDRALDVVIGGVIGGVVGARLYYVAFTWENYAANPLDIFNIREGGLAIYGGIIGGLIVVIIMCRLRRVKLLPFIDLAAGGVILGQAIGRWGNFFNVEAFGSNTTAPWGMAGPSIAAYLEVHKDILAAQGVAVDPSLPVHPTFFYESVWCLAGFVLIALYTKRRRFDGELTLIYAAWYGFGRALIEGLRTDSLMWGNIRVSQALAAALTIAAAAVLVYVRADMKRQSGEKARRLYVDTEEGQSVVNGTFYKKPGAPAETDDAAGKELSADSIKEKTDAEQTTEGEDAEDESKAD